VSEDRLAAIVADLECDLAASRPPARRREIRPDDAADLAEALHAEMELGTAVRARRAEAQGDRIACSAGCNHCCAALIMVYEPEARAVARWLAQPARRAAREGFLRAYPAWRQAVGDAPQRARSRWQARDHEAFARLMSGTHAAGALCAFDRDGRCTIYPVRPNVCRNCHALETPERCAPGSPQPPQALAFTPIDDFLRRATTLQRAMQRAMTGRDLGPVALCVRVHELLTGERATTPSPPGRNTPCPCGSGKKYKRCCGA